MTPVALWTGRLPGLRPLPRNSELGLVGAVALCGAAGALGLLGTNGAYIAPIASLVVSWAVWRHRWPTGLPRRLRAAESPRGPDERAVRVEVRGESVLLGWDVGILWFEKAGVGFAGQTVSFVLPRALMRAAPAPPVLQTVFRAPQLTAKVFETVVGIVPLGEEIGSQTTLARIDALPDDVALETILPPAALHPELLHRALAVRRRRPLLSLYAFFSLAPAFLQTDDPRVVTAKALSLLVAVGLAVLVKPLPTPIRDRLR